MECLLQGGRPSAGNVVRAMASAARKPSTAPVATPDATPVRSPHLLSHTILTSDAGSPPKRLKCSKEAVSRGQQRDVIAPSGAAAGRHRQPHLDELRPVRLSQTGTPPVSRKPSVQDTKDLELSGRPPRSPPSGPDRV